MSLPQPTAKVFWQLEAARGAAAAYIALCHLVGTPPEMPFFFRAILGFGQEVVILFFLISGFVIHWSTAQKPGLTFGHYIQARTLRIYPLLILALGIAAAVAHYNNSVDPRASFATFVGNLLMLQDCGWLKPGVWVETYAGVLVLWSLSYEWWFYILYFPIAKKIPARAQAGVIAVLSVSQAVVYTWHPNPASRIFIYFSIWWIGVELARLYINRSLLNLRALFVPLVTVSAVALILSINTWGWYMQGLLIRAGTYPLLEVRHFIAALLITGVALAWHRLKWAGLKPVIGPFALVAPWSYALYILHEPIGVHAGWFNFVPDWALRTGLNLLLVATVAWLAERYYQQGCRRFFSR